jgi:exosortase
MVKVRRRFRRPAAVFRTASMPLLESGTWFVVACCLAWAMPSLLRMAAQPGVAGQDGQYIVVIPAAVWLIWLDFPRDQQFVAGNPALVMIGLVVLVTLHLLAWVVGTLFIEILMVYGVVVLLLYRYGGVEFCRRLWFPLLFLLAALPLPAVVMAPATRSLKLLVAEASVGTMSGAGYEVARSGSMIFISQYELVVDAACSGVNSIVSLIAVGLMYAYLRGRTTPARVAVLVLASVPVAVAANIIRVVMLGVMTSHWGVFILDTPLHAMTGLVMFVFAVLLLLLVDAMFGVSVAIASAMNPVARRKHEALV